MTAERAEIVLFHYKESIFSHRVLWYLHLNGIKYSECIQPGWLPRPDITDGLHINYRRMPIMAIGRDIYCDTRVILEVLERKFAKSSFQLNDPASQGVRKLFESHCMHGGVIWRAATLLPMGGHPFLKGSKFFEDREKMLGRPFNQEALMKARPEALAHMRMAFELMETTFLADGRQWILGNYNEPSLADIDAIYPLQWIVRDPLMKGGTPQQFINEKQFPRTFAWIDRFLAAIAEAEANAPPCMTLSGEQAIARIFGDTGPGIENGIETDEPLGLNVNDTIEVTAGDNAPSYSDHGKLLRLTLDQVCILNDKGLRLHFPRWNFHIQKSGKTKDKPIVTDAAKTSLSKEMKLIYHPMSAFSRKAYMFAIELGLDQHIVLEKVVVAPISYPGWSDDNEKVAKFNPAAKIPTLIPEAHGDGIYDSRTITEYFLAVSKAKPTHIADEKRRWRLKTLQSLGDAILDAFVLIVYENKIRAENGVKSEAWIVGQKEKIDRSLDSLEMETKRGTLRILETREVAAVADVTVAAALAFSDIMLHVWRTGRPGLAEWFSSWEKRDSFKRTKPDVDWKTGEASPDAFAAKVVAGKL